MRYGMMATILAGMVGCAWFDGDDDDDRRETRVEPADRVDGMDRADATKVGFSREELHDDPTGDTAVDPVSGAVVSQKTRRAMTWKGMTYYFESDDNLEAFEDNPDAYVTRDGYLKKSLDEVRRESHVK